MSSKRSRLTDLLVAFADRVRRAGRVLAEPLRADSEIELGLSIPETQTTMGGDVGWGDRPPAVLGCPDCESRIYQHRSTTSLDCPGCWREFPPEAFPNLSLDGLVCPVCRDRLEHGRRHPQQVEVPEWATCRTCRYHWELEHF